MDEAGLSHHHPGNAHRWTFSLHRVGVPATRPAYFYVMRLGEMERHVTIDLVSPTRSWMLHSHFDVVIHFDPET